MKHLLDELKSKKRIHDLEERFMINTSKNQETREEKQILKVIKIPFSIPKFTQWE